MSSGHAARFPWRYESGRRQLEEAFGLEVTPSPNALRDDEWLRANPRARADDLHWALCEPTIDGVVTTIGGDDSVRTLPYLDFDLIRDNPKVLVGFSDTTVALTAFLQAGVVAFHGPSLMTDFAENGGLHPYTLQSVRRALFEGSPGPVEPSPVWSEEFLDWGEPGLQDRRRVFQENPGPELLQGHIETQELGRQGVQVNGPEGHLVGGCADILEVLKGTEWWPATEFWDGAILCLETSELVPSPQQVGLWLRNYGMQGVLQRLNGLLLGRPRGYDAAMNEVLRDQVRGVLAEFGRSDLPVLANLDVGHTSPQAVLPLGCLARIDRASRRLVLLESGVL